ncbi:synaptic vesicle transporter [Aspergillus eucalypticola CBS 122712]|uniref:Synaptic vesicle transporter n=1 Tax=Aspergillus eucalypticola (strain CBS 122712 / IBT 29274) TaxID=1448314 RepID=A0A317VSU1_ASPEC|nr:synaptic vesicle transporter [Aspergillus eucalypticola CBS 122712]PWY75898.1 synaptic vesicle transporter [Aspergillus eucalypticola CBS 122712]
METIRDSAFGKLVRFLSGYRLLLYPEELDDSTWRKYLRTPEGYVEDGLTPTSGEDFYEQHSLYTVMSQAARRRRQRPPLRNVLAGPWHGVREVSPEAISWGGPDDSENPQNWSLTKKMLVTLLICLLTFSIYIGSAIYTPGVPGVARQFGVSNVTALLGLTLFVLGYGLGPMVWAPISELPAVGRSPVYVATLVVFVFFQFAVIYAKNIGMLLAFRFLTGFLGSPVLATGGASIGDMWNPLVRDYMIAIWASFAIAAPVLGPLVGGFAASAKGWTWTIWELLWISGFALVLLFFFLPETFAPNILSRRARRIRRIMDDQRYASESEIEISHVATRDVLFESLVRPFVLCFLEPIVLLMNLYIALIYGILYIWFEAFPIVFEEKHGFNAGQDGLAFLGILIGAVCVALPGYFYWKYRWQSKHVNDDGSLSPEEHLPPACFGALCLPISLFWFGWTANFASIHWIVPIIASALFAIGGYLIFNSIFCYEAQAYPRYAASVLAGNDFLRSSFGGGFPLFATQMFHNLGVGWACTLLGCLTVLFVPYPFLLYRYGEKIRMRSKYARHGR